MSPRLFHRLGLTGHSRGLWILFVASLVNRCGTMVLPFLALYLTGARGFRPRDAGAVLAAYGAGALLAGPLGGRLSDRLGSRGVMVGSLLASGGVLALFPFAQGGVAITCMTIALALAGETFRPASQAAIGKLAPPARRRASFALIRLAINLGMSVGPALGGFLLERAPVALFVADAATSIAAGLVLLVSGHGEAPPAPANSSEAPTGPSPSPAPSPHRSPSFLVFAGATFLFGCVFFQGDASLPIFLVRDLHLPAAFFGMTFSLNTALIVALELPLNTATASWTHARTLSAGALLGAAGYGAFALVHGEGGALLAVAVWTFGEMIVFPALPAFVADVAPPARLGDYMGTYNAALAVAFVVGPYVGLRVLDACGAISLWVGSGVCGALAALLFYAVARPKPSACEAETLNTPRVPAPGKSSPG